MRGLRLVAAAVAAGVVVAGLTIPASAEGCKEQTVKLGIVTAEGCFTSRTPTGQSPVLDTTVKFRMNGFDVQPDQGTTVTFAPSDGKRGANVSTGGGTVTMSATHPQFGTIKFTGQRWAFAPPQTGDMVLSDSALLQPLPAFFGLTPLDVKQPITLTDGKASFDFTFNLGGLFAQLVTKSEKEIAFSVGVAVEDGQYRIESGKFGVSEFDLAELITVNDMDLEFTATELQADFDAVLKFVSGFGVIGGTGYGEGPKMKYAKLGLSELNKPLGSSGVYLQKLALTLFPFPPYGGAGDIGLTAGPKANFFGRSVSAVEGNGHVEVRSADTANKKAGYFKTTADFKLMTLPVANAAFTYWFGQGTQFNASVGIGLPSGKNDPGQPTYFGGGVAGWTNSRHFDLEGNARVKLLGIDLLGAKTVVSDYGMAGCLQIVAWVGGGIRWSDGRGEMLGGFTCNLGDYQRNPQAMRGAADGKTRLRLDDGQRVIRVWSGDKSGEPPQVTLTERGGDRELNSPEPGDADGILKDGDGVSMTSSDGFTAFILKDGDASNWTLQAQPGSSDIGRIESAGMLPSAKVRAKVTGTGRKRVLTWSANDIPHQKLEFAERLPDGREVPILTTTKASGSYRFTPVEGAGTYGVKRKLAVDIRQRYDTPRDELVADTYRVRRQPAPAKVRGLSAHRETDELVVQWKRSPRAKQYVVEATPVGANATYRRVVGAKKHSVRMAVGTTDRMRVRVTATNAQQRASKPAVVRIDTAHLVRSRKVAVREFVDGVEKAGPRRVVGYVECPVGTQCEGTLAVKANGRTVGTTDFTLPADMTDKIVVRTDKPVPLGARLVATLTQSGKTSRHGGSLA